MHAADIRQLFPGLKDTIYLKTAAVNVGCAPARAAYELAVERWSAGRFGWMEAERAGEDARAMFADIVGVTAGEIAIVPAVSTAAGIVAANLPPAGPARTSWSPRTNSARTTIPGSCAGSAATRSAPWRRAATA